MRERLGEVVEQGGFGYHTTVGHMIEAFCAWSARRHGWEPDPDLVVANASVLQGSGRAWRPLPSRPAP
ncbi:MAG: hypothetical protein CM1200mP26_24130 [Acidimicrobiales bacterium]|nr:MAG: hypothetical protein CM1200mP26_24130 [Acidimicrobiales bacterium]